MRRGVIDCCWKCPRRSVEPNCHGYCPEYLGQKAAQDAKNAEARRQADVRLGLNDQRAAAVRKAVRHRRKR